MTDRAAVYRDDVLAVVERHLAKWQQLEAANPPAHQFDLTTEAASKLAILDALAEIRALPTLQPGAGRSHEELIAAGDAALKRMKARALPAAPHREEEA